MNSQDIILEITPNKLREIADNMDWFHNEAGDNTPMGTVIKIDEKTRVELHWSPKTDIDGNLINP